MKPFNVLGILAITICLCACSLGSPTYFGSKYPPTDAVQTFYSAKDIKQPYKVIGHMVAPITRFEAGQEAMKLRMTDMAKKQGANALIFSDITRETHLKTTDDFSIKAEVIVFTDK